jgi:hypothetical protein
MTAGVAAFGAAAISPWWAAHYFVVGQWMNLNAGLLGRLLLAFTSHPTRLFEGLIWAVAKVVWLATLFVYCWLAGASQHPSAIVAGVLTLFAVFMLKALGWAWVHGHLGSKPA